MERGCIHMLLLNYYNPDGVCFQLWNHHIGSPNTAGIIAGSVVSGVVLLILFTAIIVVIMIIVFSGISKRRKESVKLNDAASISDRYVCIHNHRCQ